MAHLARQDQGQGFGTLPVPKCQTKPRIEYQMHGTERRLYLGPWRFSARIFGYVHRLEVPPLQQRAMSERCWVPSGAPAQSRARVFGGWFSGMAAHRPGTPGRIRFPRTYPQTMGVPPPVSKRCGISSIHSIAWLAGLVLVWEVLACFGGGSFLPGTFSGLNSMRLGQCFWLDGLQFGGGSLQEHCFSTAGSSRFQ